MNILRWTLLPFSFLPGIFIVSYATFFILHNYAQHCDLAHKHQGFLVFGYCIDEVTALLHIVAPINAAITVAITYLIAPSSKLRASIYAFIFWGLVTATIFAWLLRDLMVNLLEKPMQTLSFFAWMTGPIMLGGFAALLVIYATLRRKQTSV